MSNNKKSVKHSKIKNSAIIFELLTRQFTTDIINGKEISPAQRLIEKYFRNTTELGKEYVLYQALIKQKFDTESKAENFLSEVIDAHKKLKSNEIKKSKYSLIKEITENFDIDSFFKPKIDNYKLFASIYKIFQSKSLNENINPEDIVNSKYTIIENILGKNSEEKTEKIDSFMQEYSTQDEDLRLLAYKILVEKFNEKYSSLDTQQKTLIKEYINNISNANSLTSYIKTELPVIKKQLTQRAQKITDKVMKIKINEVANQLEIMKDLKFYEDNHIIAVLQSYELIKALDKKN